MAAIALQAGAHGWVLMFVECAAGLVMKLFASLDELALCDTFVAAEVEASGDLAETCCRK